MKVFSLALSFLCISLDVFSLPFRVSIITSVFDGDAYIKRFMENIVQQTIFHECELLLINANSPGNEDEVINEYIKQYPENIKYIKLSYDPGVYGVWNLGCFVAHAPYVTNANLDDLRYADCLEKHADYLDAHPEIALVFSDYFVSYDPVNSIENCELVARASADDAQPTKKMVQRCVAGPQPMWRKSVHQRSGYFNQQFLYSGDWEFWNRLANDGFEFAKVPGVGGVYYYNPNGLSTNSNPQKVARRQAEDNWIVQIYRDMWTS
ncbi:glycosyltransferase [bacterium]|nr:MAG: glycosyltransferase [bacterium]QQR61826.1 MAG: glycosyltransferase [bacterium]QQR62592.1 MAG: glycosyltransferase [bacterium]